VLWDSFRGGRVRLNPDRSTELLGCPDWIVEVVSDSSVRKDLHDLFSAYEKAGVREYWIADARGASPLLRIFAAGTDRHFVERVPDAQAWVHSPLFAPRSG
jgi:Uma2 family endonuclease